MENKSHSSVYVFIAIVVVVALGLYWYFSREEKKDKIQTTEEAVEALSQTTEIQTETNPLKKVPDLNPTAKTNPFKTTNPFK